MAAAVPPAARQAISSDREAILIYGDYYDFFVRWSHHSHRSAQKKQPLKMLGGEVSFQSRNVFGGRLTAHARIENS